MTFNGPRARLAMIGAILSAIAVVLFVSFKSSEIQSAGTAERTHSIQFWQAHEVTAKDADFVPAEPAAFTAIEAKCIEIAPKLQPAVVGVFSPSSGVLPRTGPHLDVAASGVVISADGLVLSQFHVSHAIHAPTLDLLKHHQPGEETVVLFSDGTERKAKLLGGSIDDDLSLLQISEPGPYSFVEFEAKSTVDAGDWVIKLGHPGGFRQDRPAPLRLGRVLLSTQDHFITDCAISGGDSGGPYFDLKGRLVGILHGVKDPQVMIHLLGEKAYSASARRNHWAAIGTSRIAAIMDQMSQNQIIGQNSQDDFAELRKAVRLSPDHWAQSQEYKKTFAALTAPLSTSVITIVNGSIPVALGTVVDQDGLAVCKASTLPSLPRCRLPNGRVVEAAIVGADKSFDLAVLRIPPESVRPIAWLERDSPSVGRIILPVGSKGQPLSIGIVSVAVRHLVNPRQPGYDLPLRVKAERPSIFGAIDEQQGEFVVRTVFGPAKVAGILPNDRLISIAGQHITSDDDAAKAVDEKQSGDLVSLVISRDKKAFAFEVPLLPAVEIGSWNRTWRCDDFPIALEYSPPVETTECGGPIIDLSGRVVGITVGQSNPANGWAIPADPVKRIIHMAKDRKLERWPER